MIGFCDECGKYRNILYKVRYMKFCRDCLRDYYEMTDEECYVIDEEKEDEDEY